MASTNKIPPAPAEAPGKRGRVVHDERGNAIWDWVAETGRALVDSTSRLLRKLEVSDLQVEGEKDQELRLESPQRDAGGGYDPYSSSGNPKSGRKT